jgi:hypothetical protein
MKIKMLETVPGSEDGYTVTDYVQGQEYEVGADLAKTFLEAGQAVAVGGAVKAKPEHRVGEAGPEAVAPSAPKPAARKSK